MSPPQVGPSPRPGPWALSCRCRLPSRSGPLTGHRGTSSRAAEGRQQAPTTLPSMCPLFCNIVIYCQKTSWSSHCVRMARDGNACLSLVSTMAWPWPPFLGGLILPQVARRARNLEEKVGPYVIIGYGGANFHLQGPAAHAHQACADADESQRRDHVVFVAFRRWLSVASAQSSWACVVGL